MKKVLKYLKYYIKESILGPLFKLLEATLELIVPLIIAAIIDTGIAASDTGYTVKMCLILVLLGAVGLAFSVTAQYFAAKAAVGCSARIRHTLFAHVQSLSHTEMDTLGTSTLITRMTSDVNQVQSGINLTLRLLLRSPFVVFGAMIMAFTIDWKSALTFTYTIPALAVVIFAIMLVCIPLYKKVQRKLDRTLVITKDNLEGARVIRAFCNEEAEILEFSKRNGELTATQKFVGRISSLLNPLTYVIINLGILLLIHNGALRVDSGAITQGQLVALYNYMLQILVELIKLANLIINVTKAVSSAGRIAGVLDVESSIIKTGECNEDVDTELAVEFSDVSFTYKGAQESSLSGISFTAKRGEVIGIIGGTGSGKSTLVNLIPRFYDATEGVVRVFGNDVKDYSPTELREKIGIVPQKAVLFEGTIRENMRWGKPDATDEEILRAVSLAQADDVLSAKGGLDANIEEGGSNLSGGQRQRLTIARALVREPKILILDDSSSALDFATDAKLRAAIKKLDTGTTVFIVSQRSSSIMHADKIIVLDDGNPVGIGTHDALLSTSSVYREIYDSQFS